MRRLCGRHRHLHRKVSHLRKGKLLTAIHETAGASEMLDCLRHFQSLGLREILDTALEDPKPTQLRMTFMKPAIGSVKAEKARPAHNPDTGP